jgi:hypothetical protein
MKKALLVGINYSNNPKITLNGCINDSVNIRNLLIDAYDYDQSNITLLSDDVNNSNTLPTYQNIINNLTSLVSNSANYSELFFQYSGHGSQIKDTNNDEADGLDEVIIPVDYQKSGVISDDTLFNIIKNVKCKMILLFDSCHSGSVCDLQWSFEYNNGNFIKTSNNNKIISNPNIFMFSGSKDVQTSADTYSSLNRQYCGAFTLAFIDALRANHHNVSIFKLYNDLCMFLIQNGYSQLPILSSSSDKLDCIFSRSTSNALSTIKTPVIIDSTKSTIKKTMKTILFTSFHP